MAVLHGTSDLKVKGIIENDHVTPRGLEPISHIQILLADRYLNRN
jgi:hypothetical protein